MFKIFLRKGFKFVSPVKLINMTKNVSELDLEGEKSFNSNESNSTDEFLINDKIIEEEERLNSENEKIANEENEQGLLSEETKENLTEKELIKKREAEIKEKRYKRLMHLLKNSKIYALLLKNRIQESEAKKKRLNNNTQATQEPSLKKQNPCAEYNIGQVLTEKCIEENSLKDGEKISEAEITESDQFKETRVTRLGFTVSEKQPLLLEGGKMRDYQLEGLDWMINLFLNGVNGILADEMGLGKTIQVIAFICYLIQQDITGPFLIVAPLSTISNWLAEFKRFAPKVPTMLYHGTEAERKALIPSILQKSKAGNKTVHRVVITSFQIPLRDSSVLKKIHWYYLIVDEGHRLKNHNSMLSRALKEYNTIGRLLLTGTPLQNDLSELWSLLNFLLPEVFSSLDVFESWFDIRQLEKNGTEFIREKFNIDVVNIMQEILMPFLLRREKKYVNLDLPPKKEILIYCPMTQLQKELYQSTIDRSIEHLVKPKSDDDLSEPLPKRRCFMNSPYATLPKSKQEKEFRKSESPSDDSEKFLVNLVLCNPQMQLRKILNHPYLIKFPLKYGTHELRIDEDMVTASGKLLVLDAMLAKLKVRGHKVVLFSYFKIILDILEDYAIMRNYSYCRLDGSSKISSREEEISKFVSNPDVFIFFISVRAGGLGINLTTADTAIFFDSDWNPQVNLQAQDRCHRIGQTKPVVVYRLCSIGTIDEKIIERGNAKRRLEKMILQKGKFTQSLKDPKSLGLMDFKELKKLFDSANHDVVINSNGFVLTDEELEAILDRSEIFSESTPVDQSNKVFKVLNYEK